MLKNPNWKPAEVELQDWQKILLKAAELVEESWNQHGYYRPAPSSSGFAFCALGAIYYAAQGHVDDIENNTRAWRADESVVCQCRRKLEMTLPTTVPVWNDLRGQTGEKVAQMMRKVAADA